MQVNLLYLAHQLFTQGNVAFFKIAINIFTRCQGFNPLHLQLAQFGIKRFDLIKMRKNFRLELFFQRRKRKATAFALNIAFALGFWLFGFFRFRIGFGFVKRAVSALFQRVATTLHGFQIHNVTQQHFIVTDHLMPRDDGAECQRAFTQAANHFITTSLNPLGNGNFALTREQFHRAHFTQIHTHGVIRTAYAFGIYITGWAFGFRFGFSLGFFLCVIAFSSGFLGLSFLVVVIFVLDNLNTHFRQHGHNVFNLLRRHFVLRENGI